MKIRNVPPERIMNILTGISFGFNNFRGICSFLMDKEYEKISSGDKNHISRAIQTCKDLGFIEIKEGNVKNGTFKIMECDFDPQIWSDNEKRTFFRKKIQTFPPFITYFDLLSKGFSSSSSAIKTSSFHNIKPVISYEENVLAKWGIYAKLLKKEGDVKIIADFKEFAVSDSVKLLKELQESLDSEIKSRIFVKKYLSEDAFNFIDENVRDDFIKSMKSIIKNPEESLRCLGNAVEDFLKQVAEKREIKLIDSRGRPLNSIGPILQILEREKIIVKKHSSILTGMEVFLQKEIWDGFNSFRKMASHGKDDEAKQRWELSSDAALITSIQIMLALRSVYYYAIEKKLKY